MSTFNERKMKGVIGVGVGALVLGLGMSIAGGICMGKSIGTPEYIVSLRNTGITMSLLSVLWLGLAASHKILKR